MVDFYAEEADITRAKQPRRIMQMSVAQWEKALPNEAACDAYLVALRWPNGVHCPRCGSNHVYKMVSQDWKWECIDCGEGGSYRFSHLIGTIFENTNLDLRQWFRVIHLMLTSGRCISVRQVQRYMGFGSYKTAWYMCRRIRMALADDNFRRLIGYVGMDNTDIGDPDRLRQEKKKLNEWIESPA